MNTPFVAGSAGQNNFPIRFKDNDNKHNKMSVDAAIIEYTGYLFNSSKIKTGSFDVRHAGALYWIKLLYAKFIINLYLYFQFDFTKRIIINSLNNNLQDIVALYESLKLEANTNEKYQPLIGLINRYMNNETIDNPVVDLQPTLLEKLKGQLKETLTTCLSKARTISNEISNLELKFDSQDHEGVMNGSFAKITYNLRPQYDSIVRFNGDLSAYTIEMNDKSTEIANVIDGLISQSNANDADYTKLLERAKNAFQACGNLIESFEEKLKLFRENRTQLLKQLSASIDQQLCGIRSVYSGILDDILKIIDGVAQQLKQDNLLNANKEKLCWTKHNNSVITSLDNTDYNSVITSPDGKIILFAEIYNKFSAERDQIELNISRRVKEFILSIVFDKNIGDLPLRQVLSLTELTTGTDNIIHIFVNGRQTFLLGNLLKVIIDEKYFNNACDLDNLQTFIDKEFTPDAMSNTCNLLKHWFVVAPSPTWLNFLKKVNQLMSSDNAVKVSAHII